MAGAPAGPGTAQAGLLLMEHALASDAHPRATGTIPRIKAPAAAPAGSRARAAGSGHGGRTYSTTRRALSPRGNAIPPGDRVYATGYCGGPSLIGRTSIERPARSNGWRTATERASSRFLASTML
jgi:hypothetical protein